MCYFKGYYYHLIIISSIINFPSTLTIVIPNFNFSYYFSLRKDFNGFIPIIITTTSIIIKKGFTILVITTIIIKKGFNIIIAILVVVVIIIKKDFTIIIKVIQMDFTTILNPVTVTIIISDLANSNFLLLNFLNYLVVIIIS